MTLARRGTVGVTRPNYIWLDFDYECRQVDLSRRNGEKVTSPEVEKIDMTLTLKRLGQLMKCAK